MFEALPWEYCRLAAALSAGAGRSLQRVKLFTPELACACPINVPQSRAFNPARFPAWKVSRAT